MTKTSPSSHNSSPVTDRTPSKWWQWILVYPAFAIALFSAVPDWLDTGKAYFLELDKSKLSEAEKLNAFLDKNLSCLGTPELWIENPDNILVDGTICNSGDILIKVQLPKPYEKTYFRGIPLDDIVETDHASVDYLGLASYASPAPLGGAGDRGVVAAFMQLAQQFSIAICQKKIDDRTILRHVKVGSTCFDEFIDSYTGEMKNRVETACRSTC